MGKKGPSTIKKSKVQFVDKKKQSSVTKFELLTPEFSATLQNFTNFYQQVLELKTKANNTSLNDEMKQVSERVKDQLEKVSSKILQNQLKSLESWIEKQKFQVEVDIDSIKNAYNGNEQSLRATGAFSEEQIKNQLSVIQSKIDTKKQIYQNYQKLLAESKNIYKKEKIQEE